MRSKAQDQGFRPEASSDDFERASGQYGRLALGSCMGGSSLKQITGRIVAGGRRRSRVNPQLEENRSEEHTSELQSLTISYAVFCLKKKKKKQTREKT